MAAQCSLAIHVLPVAIGSAYLTQWPPSPLTDPSTHTPNVYRGHVHQVNLLAVHFMGHTLLGLIATPIVCSLDTPDSAPSDDITTTTAASSLTSAHWC